MALIRTMARLTEHVAFDEPRYFPDGAGGEDRTWVEILDVRAQFLYMRGSEIVDAARLEGRQLFKVLLRSSSSSRAITTDWRMRDVRRGTQFNIREVDAVTDRRWVWVTVEAGVAI